jgi:hypothetical protein
MAKHEEYCPRCDEVVRTIRPWRGWGPAWRVWIAGFFLVLALTPFIAWDFCVMQPSIMLYLVAGATLRSFALQRTVCGRCSLELDPRGPRHGGSGVRIRPYRADDQPRKRRHG